MYNFRVSVLVNESKILHLPTCILLLNIILTRLHYIKNKIFIHLGIQNKKLNNYINNVNNNRTNV